MRNKLGKSGHMVDMMGNVLAQQTEPRYYLTTDHAASSYGIPVLVDRQTGTAYGPSDCGPEMLEDAADYVRSSQRLSADPLAQSFLK